MDRQDDQTREPIRATRLDYIDWLRGFAIVLMVLDHTRGAFHEYRPIKIVDPAQTTVLLFVSRVITHSCAPTFMLLAGAGAYLSLARGRTKAQVARDLFLRGWWMIFLEFALVQPGFGGSFSWTKFGGGVFCALGGSMILLAPFCWLPTWMVGLLGAAIVGGHNALDGWHADDWGSGKIVWQFLHEHVRLAPWDGASWSFRWPFLPWFGIMALGYGLGPLFAQPREIRRPWFAAVGVFFCLLFVSVRYANVYGDTQPWKTYELPWRTGMSFFNVEKYGPSLAYATMTLGPILLLMVSIDRANGPRGKVLTTIGRVPLFFYLLHLWVIQAIKWPTHTLREFWLPQQLLSHGYIHHSPEHLNITVIVAWVGTVVVVLITAVPSLWYARLKRRSKSWWLYFL